MSVRAAAFWRVRRMRPRDVAAVLAIERQAYDFPWSERVFRDCLRVGYRAWVVQQTRLAVAGYALASIAVGEAHLLNLCVAPDSRRGGAAACLLEAVIAQCERERAAELLLEVRPSNRAARWLYARYGFAMQGRRPDYYPTHDGREDALLLSRILGS